MEKYNEVKKSIIEILQNDNAPNICDLSDIGNLIGIAVGPYINDEFGYDKDGFIHGFKHGVSLIDGTH